MRTLNKPILSSVLFLLFSIGGLYANTNNSNSLYYEVDLTYPNVINGKIYTEEADLLRDKQWLKDNNIHKAGDGMMLSIPEFGVVNAKATVIKLVPIVFNSSTAAGRNSNMVTGKFIHYSSNVMAYKLKDIKTGYTQTIKATPNHAFYVKNRLAYNRYLKRYSHFIEIQNITPKDTLINENGNEVKLVCNNVNNNLTVCGKEIVTNKQNPTPVYNLEIYGKHQFLVSSLNNSFSIQQSILVHNANCGVALLKKTATSSIRNVIRDFSSKVKLPPQFLLPPERDEISSPSVDIQQEKNVRKVLNIVTKEIIVSSTGRSNYYWNWIHPSRIKTYMETSVTAANNIINKLRDMPETKLSEMRKLCAGNCGEQAAYSAHLLNAMGYNTHVYGFDNAEVLKETLGNYDLAIINTDSDNWETVHGLGVVFSEDNMTPNFIIDPWAGRMLPWTRDIMKQYAGLFSTEYDYLLHYAPQRNLNMDVDPKSILDSYNEDGID